MGDENTTLTVIDDDLWTWKTYDVRVSGEGAARPCVVLTTPDDRTAGLELRPDQARDIARVLLAAADHADEVAAVNRAVAS